MMRALALGAVVASLVAAAPGLSGQQPKFSAGVELVTVDVVATSRDGAPVRRLAAADFELSEDGVVRPIETFQFIDTTSVPAEVPLPSGVVGNQREPGGLFALVIDELGLQVTDARDVRRVAARFFEQSLAENDYVAVLRGNADSGFFLTADRALALDAIAGSSGFGDRGLRLEMPEERADGGPPIALDNPDRAVKRASFDTLVEVVRRFRPIRARRKVIVWISRGGDLKLDEFDEVTEGSSRSERSDDRLTQLIDSARAANVAIYTLDPRGLSAPSTAGAGAPAAAGLDEMGTLRQLADATGGRAIVNNNDLNGALDWVAAENRAYYLLGYTPRDAGGSRRPRKLKVTTRAPGVALLHRTMYVPGTKAESAAPDLMSTPLPVRDLPITLAPAVVAGARGRRGIVVPFEIGSGLSETAEVNYVAVALDPGGKLVAKAAGRVRVAEGTAIGSANLAVDNRIYQVRVAGSIKGTESRGLAMATVNVPKAKSDPAVCGGFVFEAAHGQRALRVFDRQQGLKITTLASGKAGAADGFAFGLATPGHPPERSWPAAGQRIENGLWQFTLELKPPLPRGTVEVTLTRHGDVVGAGCRTTLTFQ